jgi:hypothetical protein
MYDVHHYDKEKCMPIYLAQQSANGNLPPEMLLIMFGTLMFVLIVGGLVALHVYFTRGKDDKQN